ncbi:MAG TPA: lysophospholipid acyltransferase family protein [Gaiellaceae bacterium]
MQAAYRIEVRGAERVPVSGALIVAANHESLVDPFVLGTAIPRTLHFVAKEELWSTALSAWILDWTGTIPVARGRGDMGAMGRARDVLEQGEAIALFPEGGVRRHGPWLRGAARLALATGTPILPVRLLGTAGALSPGRFGFPRLAVLIDEPLQAPRQRPTVGTARELTGRLQRAVQRLGT